ncbi:hypothetical protein FJZ17_04140 [Candidatus Pacearchaeota archaeon]|nr:hypothetical protein [Candidatus Pacearchaeota archaeon]
MRNLNIAHRLGERIEQLGEFGLLGLIGDFSLEVSSATAVVGLLIDKPDVSIYALGGVMSSFFLKSVAIMGEYVFSSCFDTVYEGPSKK